jgi:hypothetical protein
MKHVPSSLQQANATHRIHVSPTLLLSLPVVSAIPLNICGSPSVTHNLFFIITSTDNNEGSAVEKIQSNTQRCSEGKKILAAVNPQLLPSFPATKNKPRPSLFVLQVTSISKLLGTWITTVTHDSTPNQQQEGALENQRASMNLSFHVHYMKQNFQVLVEFLKDDLFLA